VKLNVPSYIQEYVDHAKKFEDKEQYDKAADIFRQALTQHPNIAVLHNNLGCALANQGKYEEAREEFLQAIILTITNHHDGIVIPESYPQEPEQNLRAVESYIKDTRQATLSAKMPVTRLSLRLDPSGKVFKIPQKVEFKPLELLPLFTVWNEQNKRLTRNLLAWGFVFGTLIGYVIGVNAWGQPYFYAWYFGLWVETYTFVSAIKIIERHHYKEANIWTLCWLKITYWFFFSLLVEGSILLLERINSGVPWLTILLSYTLPNGVVYSNTLNAILIGIICAFPSKIILQSFSNFFKWKLPFPFSELAENVIEKYNEPIFTHASEEKENSAK